MALHEMWQRIFTKHDYGEVGMNKHCEHVDQPMSASGDCVWCRMAKLRAQIEAVKKCVRYQTIVEVNGEQVKVACFLTDHVLAKLGMDVKERHEHAQESGK
jgi:hypothetical protein